MLAPRSKPSVSCSYKLRLYRVYVCVSIPCFTTEISVVGTHEKGNGNGNANAVPGSRKYLSKATLRQRQRRRSPWISRGR